MDEDQMMTLSFRLLLTALCLAAAMMLNAYGDFLLTSKVSAAPVLVPLEEPAQPVAEYLSR